jgi:hypothetical protein
MARSAPVPFLGPLPKALRRKAGPLGACHPTRSHCGGRRLGSSHVPKDCKLPLSPCDSAAGYLNAKRTGGHLPDDSLRVVQVSLGVTVTSCITRLPGPREAPVHPAHGILVERRPFCQSSVSPLRSLALRLIFSPVS